METPNLNNPEKNKSSENLEQKTLNRALELVKTNPDFEYVVSINGNLDGRGETIGQQDYHFDQGTQKVVRSSVADNSSEYLGLDYNNLKNPDLIPFKPNFEIKDWKRKFDGKEFRHYIYRLAFNPKTENKFTNDHRPNVHISTALRVSKDKKIFDECGDEKLKEYLAKDTPEARKFFGQFFSKCNEEFILEYWQFVLKQKG